jgi:hypothetical protein
MKKLVCGVGINDADYATQVTEAIGCINGRPKWEIVWCCPFYRTWRSMLKRGYSNKHKAAHPTYQDVTVCEEWHLFSTFKAWMQAQDCEGKQLDKDLLVEGNKIYSPETCVFVSGQVNRFLIDSGAARGECKIGVYRDKLSGKFRSQCSNPSTKRAEYLGMFTTEQEAHEKWLAKKLEHAYALAALQTDERVAKALIDRYSN